MMIPIKNLFKWILFRIKITTQRDSKLTMIAVLIAFMIATIISIITALGVPTGPTLKNRVFDILIAIGLNSIGFILFVIIFSIILSILFIPLPRLLLTSIIYTGLLHGIVLHEAKSGLSFSVFIGVMTTLITLIIGFIFMIFYKTRTTRIFLISVLVISVIGFTYSHFSNSSAVSVVSDGQPHPAQPGPYQTTYFTYGSGTDLHREEYAAEVSETSRPVDASHFITRWSGKREKFWGFNQENFPINGRVWLPEGDGNFPIILMVHGNHTMEYFSTDGYDYLGELLASQGFIFISVDEDYVNYSNIVGQPNDNYLLRTWILLQHLVQLKELNNNPNSQFYKKIDFQQVALAGHSRGGQAAAMAANYERFFDDSILLTQLKDVQMKAVAAISPTEKQIDNQRAVLNNIAYMVLHGSKDSDVYDFRGNRQFHRTHLKDDPNLLKSAVYIENANHVFFNTSWGTNDLSLPRGVFLDRSSLMDKFEQQFIAKSYFSAFFKKVFHDDSSGESLLRNSRTMNKWLPDVNIVSQYQPHGYQTIENFNRRKEPNGLFNNFVDWEVMTPEGRTGKNHPQDVLELTWEDEASFSFVLSDEDLINARNEKGKHLVLSIANSLPNSQPKINIGLETINGVRANVESFIPEVIEIDNTVFGLFDQFFRDGKYEQSWEPVFQTIEVPLDRIDDMDRGDVILTIDFKASKGKVMLEEIGVY